MERILFENAAILTLDSESRFYRSADLVVSNGKIESLNQPRSGNFTRIINASGLLLMPGLVNAHTHSPMSLLRGLRDDCPLDEWLQVIWPAENAMSRQDCYNGALLGIAEAVASGTTSVTDMYRHSAESVRAAAESGIKANICESITCDGEFVPEIHEGVRECISVWNEWNGYDNGRILCDTTIQSLWQTPPSLWEYISGLAQEKEMGIHIHCAETKSEMQHCASHYSASPIELLERFGVFHSRTILVHGIYLSEKDVNLLQNYSDTFIVHDPASNLKCCCGFANLRKYTGHGIPVALATDGVCSNNSGDMFEAIRLTGLLQKMLNDDPAFLPAEDILRMAIQNGLNSQGRTNEAGMIVPGMDADLIAVDLSVPGMMPMYHPEANLAYSASGGMVRMTMVRGNVLYENGEYTTIDIEKLRYETAGIAKRLSRFS